MGADETQMGSQLPPAAVLGKGLQVIDPIGRLAARRICQGREDAGAGTAAKILSALALRKNRNIRMVAARWALLSSDRPLMAQ
jgi:hypothetical protein